jgi:hypothetical protein
MAFWALLGKACLLVEGNAVLKRAGVGLTLVKSEKEKVEFLHVIQKR